MVTPLRLAPLGNTGLDVALLSLGTVKFGRDQGVKYPKPVTIPDDRAARDLLNTAADLGINMLDTAPAYGVAEQRLGELIAGRSEHWVICTKVGEEFENGQSRYDFSPEHCRFSVERSLTRLQMDVVDIVLIHSNGDDLDILNRWGTLDALQELKTAGKVRAIGISHKTPAGGYRALELGADVIMATLNRTYVDERGLIADAAAQGCGVLIKKALASGHGTVQDLRFVATRPGVHSVVVGTTNRDHLVQNVSALTQPEA